MNKIFQYIDKINIFKIYFIFINQFFLAFFELLAIGSIIPFALFIISPDQFFENKFIIFLTSFFEINLNLFDHFLIVQYLIFSIILLFIVKTLVIFLINYFQLKFFIDLGLIFKNKILKYYLNQNLTFIQNNKKSNLIRNIDTECDHLCDYINNVVLLSSELLFVLLLCVVLYLLDPTIFIFTLLFIVALFSFYIILIKKRLTIIGGKRKTLNEKILESLQQIFNGFIEIKIFKKEDYFISDFKKKASEYKYLFLTKKLFNLFPKYITELFIIIIFFSIIYYQTQNLDSNVENLIFHLSTYLIIVIRMLPSANKILSLYQELKFLKKTVLNISDLYLLNPKDSFDTNNNSSEYYINDWKKIKLENFSFDYDKKKIFEHANIEINKGDIIYLEGESGKGKTTFLNILIGLLNIKNGKITIDDKTVQNCNNIKFSYVPQKPFLLNESILSNITINDERIDKQKLDKILNITGIDKNNFKIDIINENIGDNASKLSGGQAQRISIARSLYYDAEFLIFDEATNALDANSENKIIQNLISNYKNLTIIICSHNKYMSNLCKRSLSIKEKNIIELNN